MDSDWNMNARIFSESISIQFLIKGSTVVWLVNSQLKRIWKEAGEG